MKRYLPFVIVVGVALVTFGSGTMLYRAKRPQIKNIPESQSVAAKGDASTHVRGNPDAPVTLEEFGDFQCPPCGQFAVFVEELLREYDSRYPGGALGPEATALRVEALLRAGDRTKGQALGEKFVAQHPNGPYATRIRSLLSQAP